MEPITTAQRAKSLYTLPPAKALRREGRPVRPWREAHSLSPCPVGQRQRLRTRKPDSIARVLHPRSDDTRCCPADSSWACPPSSWRIDVYSHKVPARPEAQSALQGRGTELARWWGHEVLKGPNTLADIQFPLSRKYRNGGFGVADFPVPYFYHTSNCCPWLLQSIGCRRCPHHRACARSPSPHREDWGRADLFIVLLVGYP